MDDMKKTLEEAQQGLKEFSKDSPEKMHAFAGLTKAVETGKIPAKDKALIAIALSVATHCKWCVALHVKDALKKGASEEEIQEATWMAVLMGGGPALMYGRLVLKAIDEFKE